MDMFVRRLLIQLRLQDGRLPRARVRGFLYLHGEGQSCDGCGTLITKAETVVTVLFADNPQRVQMHRECFQSWNVERGTSDGHEKVSIS